LAWIFQDKQDGRTELEKRFYKKSDWKPPNAGVEVENFIKRLQEKFDKWKPPRFAKDNLTAKERLFIKEIKEDKNIMYMWEDKGPSFVKMKTDQYLKAGEEELNDVDCYEQVMNDPTKKIKQKNDIIVDAMIQKGEIPEKVGEYLKDGEVKLARFYHLLKTHKIPPSIGDAARWLDERGFPTRGIISCCGTPTERLAGFVDFFLQAGMKNLDTFLQDTKHTLQIIENLNDQVRNGEVSMDGVALVSMDVENMYKNMSENLATGACREFVDSDTFKQDGNKVSRSSILTALDLCLKNNFFTFNEKTYKQISGVGTGVKLAPTYACLGLGNFEKTVFNSNQELLQQIVLWKRPH
jgi:hypothetical protein